MIATHSEDVARALVQVAEFINKSGNKEAGAIFNNFNEELSKPEPQKAVLRTLWNGVVGVLPDIAKISEAAGKIASLFG